MEGISAQHGQQRLRTSPKSCGLNFFGVLACVFCENEFPRYHGSFLAHLLAGVFIPFIMDSRMPLVERRYSVS